MLVETDAGLDELIKTILGAAFEVSSVLGHGFLEKVYRNALTVEIESRGLNVSCEVPFAVGYKGRQVGTYLADLVVADRIVVELKVADSLVPEHIGQVVNYLRASGLGMGLLLNFGRPRLQYRRVLL